MYSKPEVSVVSGSLESVFAASGAGGESCDCFSVQSIFERPNAGKNQYACNYEIHYNQGASHQDAKACWTAVKVKVQMDRDIPAGVTLNPANGVINGNTIIFTEDTVTPATSGDLSYNFFQIFGEGVNELHVDSISAYHDV